MRRLALAIFLGLVVAWSAGAQSVPSGDTKAKDEAPKPYQDEEFAPWMLELRRFEIIAVGAFPIAYLFVGMTYDYAYYLSSGYPQDYRPWPAGPGTSGWTGDDLQAKNLTLLAATAGVSLAIAGADWLLGRAR